MRKVALIIIYNHQYNKNIDVLERIYKDRFSDIYHLVPFYFGDKKNVIPVYECSFYFQGYISQGLRSYFKEEYAHYFFVADDMILNPKISERNYFEYLKLTEDTSYIPQFISLHEGNSFWPRVGEAFRWRLKLRGIEAENQLPTYDVALNKFQQFNLVIKPLRFNQIWKTPRSLKEIAKLILKEREYFSHFVQNILVKRKYLLPYPIVGSYSDICVVSSDSIELFCHYCGVFASTKLHVEIALPTSLVLSANKIVTDQDLFLQGKALWTKADFQELEKYKNSLKNLLEHFPPDYLYLHPIKLSKWEIEL